MPTSLKHPRAKSKPSGKGLEEFDWTRLSCSEGERVSSRCQEEGGDEQGRFHGF